MNNILFTAFRDKGKYFLYILLLLFVSILFLILSLFHEYYTYQIYEVLGKKEENRGIVIENTDDNVKKKIAEMKEIVSFEPLYFDIKIFDTKKKKISVNVYRQDELLMGIEPREENDIVISKFYYNILELEEDDIQRKKEIKVYIDNQEVNLNIVGVTSNNQINLYMQESLFTVLSNNNPQKYYVVVDEYKNLNKVTNEFLESGYFSELKDATGNFEIEKMKTTQKTLQYILFACFLLLFTVLFYIIKNIFYAEGKNISILKAIGFPTYKICFLLFFQMFVLIVFSILFLFFMYGLVYFIFRMNNFQIVKFLSSIPIFKLLWIEFVTFLLVLFMNILSYIHKVKNMNILKVLNDE